MGRLGERLGRSKVCSCSKSWISVFGGGGGGFGGLGWIF